MPPAVPKTITRPEGISAEEAFVLSFAQADTLGAVLKECGFTQRVRIRKLLSIFKNGDPKEAIAAHKEIDKIIQRSLEQNGLVVSATQRTRTESEGRTIDRTLRANRLVNAIAKEKIDAANSQPQGREQDPLSAAELDALASTPRRALPAPDLAAPVRDLPGLREAGPVPERRARD